MACTGMASPHATDHADRSRREPSLRPTSGTGGRRRAPTAAAVRHDRYAGHAAGRRRARPTVGGPPDSIRQRAAQVLIAAILHPTIRGARITTGGACRAWALLKPADDRRGSGTGSNRRRAFRRPTRLAATDAVQQPGHDPALRSSENRNSAMNVTLVKALVALVPACMLSSGSVVLFLRGKS